MNWEAAGAIGEMVGALGVIASLLYLASQIRASSIASKVEARLTTTGFMTQFNSNFINNPELYDIWNRARKGSQNLSENEFAQFSNLNFNAFWLFSAGHYQMRMGTLGPGDWFELEAIMRFYIQNKGVHEWWERFSETRFDPAYVEFVNDSIIEQSSDDA